MNVDSIGSHPYLVLDGGRAGRSHPIDDGTGEVRKKAKLRAQAEELPVTDELEPTEGEETEETGEVPVTDELDPTAGEETEETEARGVLRLLQAGHFQGVADIRLRLNFAEELAGAELPELSTPKGNGKAYAKFLAVYQDMQGSSGTDDVETPDNPDSVDTPETPEPVDVVA